MSNTTTRSWLQMVQDADPDFRKRPWVYEFSNGRRFDEPAELYPQFLTADDNTTLLTGDGTDGELLEEG